MIERKRTVLAGVVAVPIVLGALAWRDMGRRTDDGSVAGNPSGGP